MPCDRHYCGRWLLQEGIGILTWFEGFLQEAFSTPLPLLDILSDKPAEKKYDWVSIQCKILNEILVSRCSTIVVQKLALTRWISLPLDIVYQVLHLLTRKHGCSFCMCVCFWGWWGNGCIILCTGEGEFITPFFVSSVVMAMGPSFSFTLLYGLCVEISAWNKLGRTLH
jgi:hypothetical protein